MRLAWLAEASNVDWPAYFRACAFLVGMVLIGAAVAMWLRRRYLSKREDPFKTTGFSLKDLRRLRETGQLTDEEFGKMKGIVVGAVKSALEKPKPAATQSPDAPPNQPPSPPQDEPPADSPEPPTEPPKTDNS